MSYSKKFDHLFILLKCLFLQKYTIKLDSMRWFSHRRSLSPLGGHAMVSSVAAWCVQPSYGARPTMHCKWGWLSFLSLVTMTFELGDIFVRCT